MEIVENVHGTCRLPYTLLKDGKEKEYGYLLSSKDVCTLDMIPELINSGVKSFKIEGRMKSKEYVGIVTSIYRKYIDLAESGKEYKVDKKDREALMQIFNRGGFSTGYLKGKLGKEMMYIDKPNHVGVNLGKVISYNPNKTLVKVKLENEVNLGDSISINNSSCKISELMIENRNIKTGNAGQIVTIGRIKGKIFKEDIVYKTVSEILNKEIDQKITKENIKRKISAKIYLKKNENIKLEIKDGQTGIKVIKEGLTKVEESKNNGISEERIKEQLSKTGNTPFKMKSIDVQMDSNITIAISSLNSIRRDAIEELEKRLLDSFKKNKQIEFQSKNSIRRECKDIKVSVSFNNLKGNINYENLKNINNVYIPFKFFIEKKEIVNKICNKFDTYILMPNITKSNYEKLLEQNLDGILNKNIKGIVISNLSHLELLGKYKKNLEIIANYTLNIANDYTIEELKKFGVSKYIISPEADKEEIESLSNQLQKELIVYGRALLMTTEYCLIGSYKNCTAPCTNGVYKLKDRMGFEFPIYTDRVNCNNLIYNSKTTSINYKNLNVDWVRIDILEETEEEIQNIINIHKKGERLEGQNYTNGNLNREI